MRFYRAGYTMTESLVVVLSLSLLALAGTKYLRSLGTNLKDSSLDVEGLDPSAQLKKKIQTDLLSVAPIYPSCDTNPSDGFIGGNCSDLKVRGAVTPLPARQKTQLHELATFVPQGELMQSPGSMARASDGIRLAVLDNTGSFNCKLSPRHTSSDNPSTTSGSASGAERFWAHPQCAGLLNVGALYVMVEEISNVVFGNVFQITALSTQTLPDSTQEIQVDASSDQNSYNQVGGLGRAGFTDAARIYPIKLVEYVVGDDKGLYRREFSPTSQDMLGKGDWQLVNQQVASMQFSYVLGDTTARYVHLRSLYDLGGDAIDNGIEDIIGISIDLVLKTDTNASEGFGTVDNPHTAEVETDQKLISRVSFYLDFRNQAN